jgi:hypothetical protein
MIEQHNDNPIHWNYFLALDEDLAHLSRYIEFTEDNYDTYSIELAHLLLASASEIDVTLKLLCNLKNVERDHQKIIHYIPTIKSHIAELITEKCFIPRYGIELNPWGDIADSDESPLWWKAYNKVKHERNIMFKQASLKNVLNSMAALSLANLYLYRELYKGDEQVYEPSVLHMKRLTSKLSPHASVIKFNDDYYYDRVVV